MVIGINLRDESDDNGDDSGPLFGRSWKDKSEDIHPIPQPSVRQLLDQMTDEERLEIFSHYCTNCGGKDRPCYCQYDE